MKTGCKIILTIIFLMLLSPVWAQRSYMLSGLVVDGDNKPISGAMIKINNLSVAEQAVSDQDGLYYSRLLPAGGYWVYVYVGGQRLNPHCSLAG